MWCVCVAVVFGLTSSIVVNFPFVLLEQSSINFFWDVQTYVPLMYCLIRQHKHRVTIPDLPNSANAICMYAREMMMMMMMIV